jgi:hypothetical protein
MANVVQDPKVLPEAIVVDTGLEPFPKKEQ